MLAVLGDTHIPGRAKEIPPAFIKELKTVKPDKILFTGDSVILEPIKQLEAIAPVTKVRGNMDQIPAPEEEIVQWDLPILMIHGHQIHPRGDKQQLEMLGIVKKCKIVIFGHTHKPEIVQENIILINPGSATGAYPGIGVTQPPSMFFLESN